MNSHTHIGRAAALCAALWLALAASVATAAQVPPNVRAGAIVSIPVHPGGRFGVMRPGVVPALVTAVGHRVWLTAADRPGVWLVDTRSGRVRHWANVARPATVGLATVGGRGYVLGAENLKVIDPAYGVSKILLRSIPGSSALLTAGPSGLWGFKGNSVFRVELDGGRGTVLPADTVELPLIDNEEQNSGPEGMAADAGSVWVVGDRADHRMWQVGGRIVHIERTVQLGFAPAGVATGGGSVWVTDQIGGRVVRFDAQTGKLMHAYRTEPDPMAVVYADGHVWVTNDVTGTVAIVDPVTGSRRLAHVGGAATGLSYGIGRVWAAVSRLPHPHPAGIRIGVALTCRGPFKSLLQQTLAGAELPLIERGARLHGTQPTSGLGPFSVAGHRVSIVTACETWSDHASTISALSRLVDTDHAQVVLGPTFEGDSLAVRDFAHAHPGVTFMLTGYDQSATLRFAASNVFRFQADSVQWYAGLGTYARKTLGWNTAATVANADGSSWPLVQAFQAEFCSEGGTISPPHGVWVDVGGGAQLGDNLPTGVDGVFLPGGTPGPYGGTDTFVPKWAAAHPPVGKHLIVGWPVLGAADSKLVGVVGSSSDPYAPTPRFTKYYNDYASAFPQTPDPGLVDQGYYDAMNPLLEALAHVGGRLGLLRDYMAKMTYHGPAGDIWLDSRHQAVVPIYLAQVTRSGGSIGWKQIRVIHNVDEGFHGLFSPTSPAPSKTSPACVAGNPPPWS